MENRPSSEYERVHEELIAGPRRKTAESVDLEYICKSMLEGKPYECKFNTLGELEVTIDKKIYNLTLILKGNYDLSHLELTDDDINHYPSFLKDEAQMKPALAILDAAGQTQSDIYGFFIRTYPTPEHYAMNDPHKRFEHLNYPEKLAITLYTTDYFSIINAFLRQNGSTSNLKKLKPAQLNLSIKELLLATAIAARGLNKPIPRKKMATPLEGTKDIKVEEIETELVYRREDELIEEVDAKRKAALETKRVVRDAAFTSVSADPNWTKRHEANGLYKTYIYYEQPRNIRLDYREISAYPNESEKLFPPGTDYAFIAMEELFKAKKYKAVPVRPVGEAETYVYDSDAVALRSAVLYLVERYSEDTVLKTKSMTELEAIKKLESLNPNKQLIALDARVLEKIDALMIKKKLADKLTRMLPHIKQVKDKYLSLPYADADAYPDDLYINKLGVVTHRPNHGIVHTLRVSIIYFPAVLNYLAEFAKDDEVRYAAKNMSADALEKLQIAMLFSVTGRQSDLGFRDNATKYVEYRHRSAEQFRDYAKTLGWNDEEIKKYSDLILNMGDPDYLNKIGKDKPDIKLAFQLMNFSHKIDLARCYNPTAYAEALKSIENESITASPLQKQGQLKLIQLATQSIKSMGDRLCTDLNVNWNSLDLSVTSIESCLVGGVDTYENKFVVLSEDIEYLCTKCSDIGSENQATYEVMPIATQAPIDTNILFEFLKTSVELNNLQLANFILEELKARKIKIADEINKKIPKNTLLNIAINNKNALLAEALILAGADPNLTYQRGITPLHYAATVADLDAIKILEKHGAKLDARDESLDSPLIKAIESGHVACVDLLLALGANPNLTGGETLTPLHIAVNRYNSSAAELLIKYHADIRLRDAFHTDPLEHLISKMKQGFYHDHTDLVTVLLFADLDHTVELIKALDKTEDEKLIKILFEITLKYANKFDDSEIDLDPLKKIINALLRLGLDINHTTQTDYGDMPVTFLLCQKINHHTRFLSYLIDIGIDPSRMMYSTSTRSLNGLNLLQFAMMNGSDETMILLLDRYPEYALKCHLPDQKSLLEIAIQHQRTSMIDLLLQRGHDPLWRSAIDSRVLLIEKAWKNHDSFNVMTKDDRLMKLIERSEVTDYATLLWVAFEAKDSIAIEAITKKIRADFGEGVNIAKLLYNKGQSWYSLTLKYFLFALRNNQDRFLSDLFKCDIPPEFLKNDIDGGDMMMHVIYSSKFELIKLMFSRFKDQIDTGSLLIHASIAGNLDTVQYLIDQGLDPKVNYKQKTLLHYLVGSENKTDVDKLVDLFIKLGIDINAQTVKGVTALNLAVFEIDLTLVHSLLRYKPDPNIPDQKGNYPISYAVLREDDELISLLLKSGANPNLAGVTTTLIERAALNSNWTSLADTLLYINDPNILNQETQHFIAKNMPDIKKSIITRMNELETDAERVDYFEKMRGCCLDAILNQYNSTQALRMFGAKPEKTLLQSIVEKFPSLKRAETSSPEGPK